MVTPTRLNQIRDSILERLYYPYMPGQMLLSDALMPCQMITYEAQKFYNRFQSFQMMLYSYIMGPTQKINGAFQRYIQNNDIVSEIGPLIASASNNFSNAYSKAYNAATKNLTLISRYQNCSKSFIDEFNVFVIMFLRDYPQYFNTNLNFTRVDDLLVEIFSSWSELYSGISGCCSLAKNRYPPPSPAPPKMADRYLDGDALAIQCLEKVNKFSLKSSLKFHIFLTACLNSNDPREIYEKPKMTMAKN